MVLYNLRASKLRLLLNIRLGAKVGDSCVLGVSWRMDLEMIHQHPRASPQASDGKKCDSKGFETAIAHSTTNQLLADIV